MSTAHYSIWQTLELAIRLAARANEEVRLLAARAVAGPPGPKGDTGDRGHPGPPGSLPEVKAWSRGIVYAGMVVTHQGSSWQALHDTAEEPPHAEWLLIAAAGRDAPIGTVHGLYDPTAYYRAFDLVVFNGSEWRAKHDDPGPLPGDGWAISAQIGKTGRPGPAGPPGPPGPPGKAAPDIVGWTREGYVAIPIMSDGSVGPPLDLAPFFEAYHAEIR